MENKERDAALIEALEEAIKASPTWGICPTVFRLMRDEVIDIMTERDIYRDKLSIIVAAMEAIS